MNNEKTVISIELLEDLTAQLKYATTYEEVKIANDKMKDIRKYLEEKGWVRYHIYRIERWLPPGKLLNEAVAEQLKEDAKVGER